jgi:hypothetical protein
VLFLEPPLRLARRLQLLVIQTYLDEVFADLGDEKGEVGVSGYVHLYISVR